MHHGMKRGLCLVGKKPRLFMAGNIREGTGRDCFEMFSGRQIEDGTERDGKGLKIILACMGQDGTVGVNFLDGTGR